MENTRIIAILGAGALGGGLARTIAAAGLEVILVSLSDEKARLARARIERSLDADIAKWRLTDGEKNQILGRIKSVADHAAAAPADLVIEAVPEDFDIKADALSRLDHLCRPEVVFITTTAAISITKLAAKLTRPEQLIGMNFQLPVQQVPVVEVVSGLKTSDETRAKAQNFAKLLKKEVISVSESPGYVSTRVLLPFINEAMYTVMEGVATAADVDKAIRLGYGLSKGPLALADHIGLDTVLQWLDYCFRELGDPKFRPCPLLRKYVNANHLGVKTGEGFFTYPKED